jgi:hypothetical protein
MRSNHIKSDWNISKKCHEIFYKTSKLNEEVNCTEHSISVSIPCIMFPCWRTSRKPFSFKESSVNNLLAILTLLCAAITLSLFGTVVKNTIKPFTKQANLMRRSTVLSLLPLEVVPAEGNECFHVGVHLKNLLLLKHLL